MIAPGPRPHSLPVSPRLRRDPERTSLSSYLIAFRILGTRVASSIRIGSNMRPLRFGLWRPFGLTLLSNLEPMVGSLTSHFAKQ